MKFYCLNFVPCCSPLLPYHLTSALYVQLIQMFIMFDHTFQVLSHSYDILYFSPMLWFLNLQHSKLQLYCFFFSKFFLVFDIVHTFHLERIYLCLNVEVSCRPVAVKSLLVLQQFMPLHYS